LGQKVHPYGFRLGVINGWQSNWFAERGFAELLHEDLRIREHIKKKLYHAGISRIVIERRADKMSVNIHTARPGILIGKRGAEVEALRKEVSGLTNNEVFINIREIRKAELDAQLIAENVALQLERRVAFRRAMKKAVTSAMKSGPDRLRQLRRAHHVWRDRGQGLDLHRLRRRRADQAARAGGTRRGRSELGTSRAPAETNQVPQAAEGSEPR
jgi:small subunit ribosomal protein S3